MDRIFCFKSCRLIPSLFFNVFFKDLNMYLKIESVVVGLVGFVGIKEPSKSIGS